MSNWTFSKWATVKHLDDDILEVMSKVSHTNYLGGLFHFSGDDEFAADNSFFFLIS